jgi:hypothetical protein
LLIGEHDQVFRLRLLRKQHAQVGADASRLAGRNGNNRSFEF